MALANTLVLNLECYLLQLAASKKCNVQLSNNIIANIVQMISVRNYIEERVFHQASKQIEVGKKKNKNKNKTRLHGV